MRPKNQTHRCRIDRVMVACISFGAFLVAVPCAFANDSPALVVEPGEIVLTENPDVAMESEKLRISKTRVQVTYVFRNHGDKAVEVDVAFPLPPIPICVLKRGAGCGWEHSLMPGRNPLDFKLWVDEKPTTFSTEIKVGKERSLGKVEFITHHWRQVFLPQTNTEIRHEYRPSHDGAWLLDLTNENEPRALRSIVRDYCISKNQARTLGAKSYFAIEVNYRLNTARNWRGPINDFHLVLEKEKSSEVISSCIPDIKQVSPKTYEVVRKNYVPLNDLRILFLHRI